MLLKLCQHQHMSETCVCLYSTPTPPTPVPTCVTTCSALARQSCPSDKTLTLRRNVEACCTWPSSSHEPRSESCTGGDICTLNLCVCACQHTYLSRKKGRAAPRRRRCATSGFCRTTRIFCRCTCALGFGRQVKCRIGCTLSLTLSLATTYTNTHIPKHEQM